MEIQQTEELKCRRPALCTGTPIFRGTYELMEIIIGMAFNLRWR